MNISKKILLFIFISLSIISCKKVPENVLSERKLINVITDMAVLNGSISVADYRNHDYQKKQRYYQFIFEKNNVTPAQLDSSLMWYAKDPKKLELMYEKVGKNLEKRVADLEKKKVKEKVIK